MELLGLGWTFEEEGVYWDRVQVLEDLFAVAQHVRLPPQPPTAYVAKAGGRCPRYRHRPPWSTHSRFLCRQGPDRSSGSEEIGNEIGPAPPG